MEISKPGSYELFPVIQLNVTQLVVLLVNLAIYLSYLIYSTFTETRQFDFKNI